MTARDGWSIRGRRGATALEYALVLPALLLFLLGIMDMGRLVWTQATLDHAADAAARCASIDTADCGTTAAIQTYAATQAYGMSLPTSDFTVSAASCGQQVTVSAPFAFVIGGWVSPGTVTLTANACYPAQPS
jgi:Flp pilus assembly protein TadG